MLVVMYQVLTKLKVQTAWAHMVAATEQTFHYQGQPKSVMKTILFWKPKFNLRLIIIITVIYYFIARLYTIFI